MEHKHGYPHLVWSVNRPVCNGEYFYCCEEFMHHYHTDTLDQLREKE